MEDKHTGVPFMYKCEFQPCPYESKRESNCKQHMEKAHGQAYYRPKTNRRLGKKGLRLEKKDQALATPAMQRYVDSWQKQYDRLSSEAEDKYTPRLAHPQNHPSEHESRVITPDTPSLSITGDVADPMRRVQSPIISQPIGHFGVAQRVHSPAFVQAVEIDSLSPPHLTTEQIDTLEKHFQSKSKPTTKLKKEFADQLNLSLEKVNVS